MATPTLDHTEREPKGGCSCSAYVLCPTCYARLERLRADRDIYEWLERYGTAWVPVPVGKPRLRLVR